MTGGRHDDFRAAIQAALPDAAPPDALEPGRLHRFSSSGRRGDSAGWAKLFPDLRGGVFGDFRTGRRETWTATPRSAMNPAQRAALARQVEAATREREAERRRQWGESAERIARLWAACVPVMAGDPVARYLARRGLGEAWPLPSCLRLHTGLDYWHAGERIGTFPAMVAPLVAPDGGMVALHRTFLTSDGRKADVPTPKKLTPAAGPLAGAAIPLHGPARGVLGIAEGVETSLAAWLGSGVPTVAAYCASSLAAWRWPAGVQRIVIFADADEAGREAADTLRARALAAWLRCDVLTPSEPGQDWADVLLAARGAA